MTRARSTLGLAALVSCALLARASAFQDQSQRDRTYSVAVVRADGVLIPFAEYHRGTWRPIWTAVNQRRSTVVPLTLDRIDEDWWGRGGPSLEWTLWQRPGEGTSLRVTTPRVVPTPCSAQPALGTDFKAPGILPPPNEMPYPKAGIATTAPIELEPIQQLDDQDPDWRRVERALAEREFRTAENKSLAALSWRHPTPPSVRDRAPIDLQSVWHVKDSRFYYVEAMRRYPDLNPPRGRPACELVTYVAGYFWDDASERLRPVGISALITYCHMERAMFLWPFAAIREGTKKYWLFQSAGWTGESYGIAEPIASRGEVKPHVWHVAGRCR
ncbi:MAG: hypothetical protein WD690_18500 [Vicinamibacterales bacterium]